MRRSFGRIVFGIALVLFGVVGLMKSFGYDIQINLDGWWTIFIIVPCLSSVIDDGVNPGNLIGLGVGVLLLARAQDWIPVSIAPLFSWPMFMVLGGLALLFGRSSYSRPRYHRNEERYSSSHASSSMGPNDDAEYPDYFVLFGGSEMRNATTNLRGATITAIFGGVEADFSRAQIHEDISIQVTSIFGGSEIRLPSNVRVRVTGVPIFGGVSNEHDDAMSESAPLVTIHCFSLFGGSEIQ